MGQWVQDQLFYTPEEFEKALINEQAKADLRVQRAKDNTNLANAEGTFKAIKYLVDELQADSWEASELYNAIALTNGWETVDLTAFEAEDE